MFYDKFVFLCKEKGVAPTRAALDIGLSKSAPIKWRTTGATPNGETLNKIAEYFSVSVSVLLGEETKKAPTQDGERGIDEQNLKVAFSRGADPTLTKEDMDAMWEDARAFRDFIVAKRKREKEKNGG